MRRRKATAKAALPLTDMLSIFSGPAIWFGHFSFIYAAQTLICLAPAASADQKLIWVYAPATIAALAGSGFLVWKGTHDQGFLPRARLALALLSMLGILWSAVPAFLLPACAATA